MQFAQMNFLPSIRVQLLITVQNDDKKYLVRHNNNTVAGKCQKILNKNKRIRLGELSCAGFIFLNISFEYFENDICQKFS